MDLIFWVSLTGIATILIGRKFVGRKQPPIILGIHDEQRGMVHMISKPAKTGWDTFMESFIPGSKGFILGLLVGIIIGWNL